MNNHARHAMALMARLILCISCALAMTGCWSVMESWDSRGSEPLQNPDWDPLFGGSWNESSWQLQEGTFSTVTTWHEQDTGISLEGERLHAIHTRAALSPEIDDMHESNDCLAVGYLAKIDSATSVSIAADVDGDGEVDTTIELESTDWHYQKVIWPYPEVLTTTHFELVKEGEGEVVFDHLVLGFCNHYDERELTR